MISCGECMLFVISCYKYINFYRVLVHLKMSSQVEFEENLNIDFGCVEYSNREIFGTICCLNTDKFCCIELKCYKHHSESPEIPFCLTGSDSVDSTLYCVLHQSYSCTDCGPFCCEVNDLLKACDYQYVTFDYLCRGCERFVLGWVKRNTTNQFTESFVTKFADINTSIVEIRKILNRAICQTKSQK